MTRAVSDLSITMSHEEATAKLAEMTTTPPPDPKSPAGARAARNAKLNDAAWYDRFANGSPEAYREFADLSERGEADKLDRIIAGTYERPTGSFETLVDGQLSTSDTIAGVERLKDTGVSADAIRDFMNGKPLPAADYDFIMELRRQRMSDPLWLKRLEAKDAVAVRELNIFGMAKIQGRAPA
jgi:hypothetical protein